MSTTEKNMKRITILLTSYGDTFGKFICHVSKPPYSHASLSIDENEDIFYSFNYKGFVIEKPKKYRPKKRLPENVCIRMQVPENIYRLIEAEIDRFTAHKGQLMYARLGVLLCLLHIPHQFKNRYFCSQFVAEILERTGAITLQKKGSLYLPGQLLDGFDCLFSAKELVYNVI